MEHAAKLLLSEVVTHDVKRLVTTKPEGFSFVPGQGVEIAIDVPAWRGEGRPFTPTSLPADLVLEFTIKRYPERAGVTDALHKLVPGAPLRISDPFGTIRYRGPGVFIAAGAGLTPMIAILRELHRREELAGHSLIFSNKAPADVMLERELRHLLGERCILTCTRERASGYHHGRIDREFLEGHIDDTNRHFYVCGPPGFTEAMTDCLEQLGADPESLVFEG